MNSGPRWHTRRLCLFWPRRARRYPQARRPPPVRGDGPSAPSFRSRSLEGGPVACITALNTGRRTARCTERRTELSTTPSSPASPASPVRSCPAQCSRAPAAPKQQAREASAARWRSAPSTHHQQHTHPAPHRRSRAALTARRWSRPVRNAPPQHAPPSPARPCPSTRGCGGGPCRLPHRLLRSHLPGRWLGGIEMETRCDMRLSQLRRVVPVPFSAHTRLRRPFTSSRSLCTSSSRFFLSSASVLSADTALSFHFTHSRVLPPQSVLCAAAADSGSSSNFAQHPCHCVGFDIRGSILFVGVEAQQLLLDHASDRAHWPAALSLLLWSNYLLWRTRWSSMPGACRTHFLPPNDRMI